MLSEFNGTEDIDACSSTTTYSILSGRMIERVIDLH